MQVVSVQTDVILRPVNHKTISDEKSDLPYLNYNGVT